MKNKIHKGFTLIELLFVIGVIGLLAFMAMPSYGDGYPIRARVSELILAGSSAKTGLSEGMQTYHSWSAGWMSAITISATGMVASATVGSTGQIIVHGTAATSGAVITMTPTVTTDDKLVWSCTGTPAKYMPASCR